MRLPLVIIRSVGMGKYSVGPPLEDEVVVVSVVASGVSEEVSGGVESPDDATVIVLDESVIVRPIAVEVAEIRMVYVPLSTNVPALFFPSQTLGSGLVTLELEYSDLIMTPLADNILMDAFTCSEKRISMVVVVARPEPTVAAGYIVSCESVYVVSVGGSAACANTGKRKSSARNPAVRIGCYDSPLSTF